MNEYIENMNKTRDVFVSKLGDLPHDFHWDYRLTTRGPLALMKHLNLAPMARVADFATLFDVPFVAAELLVDPRFDEDWAVRSGPFDGTSCDQVTAPMMATECAKLFKQYPIRDIDALQNPPIEDTAP